MTLFYLSREYRIRTCDPLFPKQMRYQAALIPVATPVGFEPTTNALEERGSIQLSYGAKKPSLTDGRKSWDRW